MKNWIRIQSKLLQILASVTTSNPEIDQQEYKRLQVDVVNGAIENKKISEQDFIDFITGDTENGKFLREIIEQGILSKESIDVLEDEVKDLVLGGII